MTGASLFIPASALAVDPCSPVTPGPTPPEARVVVNDGWFPNIDLAALRRAVRIRDSVTTDRLREAVVGAIITIGNDLGEWAGARRAVGAASLAAVTDQPNPVIDGEPRLVILYRRAIGATAKADLVERYRDTDLTGAGQRRVEDMDDVPSELRRDATYAVRDILRRTRVAIELI